MVLSMDSWNEHGVIGHRHDSEMSPRQCEVCSPDISLHFLEPCIRMQTSTSWMIHSVQWMQESADTCSNSEFAPVFLSSLLSRNSKEIREESSGKPFCFRRLSSLCPLAPPFPPFPPQKIHRREILHHDEVKKGQYKRCSSVWRPVGSVFQGVRDKWQIPPVNCS